MNIYHIIVIHSSSIRTIVKMLKIEKNNTVGSFFPAFPQFLGVFCNNKIACLPITHSGAHVLLKHINMGTVDKSAICSSSVPERVS